MQCSRQGIQAHWSRAAGSRNHQQQRHDQAAIALPSRPCLIRRSALAARRIRQPQGQPGPQDHQATSGCHGRHGPDRPQVATRSTGGPWVARACRGGATHRAQQADRRQDADGDSSGSAAMAGTGCVWRQIEESGLHGDGTSGFAPLRSQRLQPPAKGGAASPSSWGSAGLRRPSCDGRERIASGGRWGTTLRHRLSCLETGCRQQQRRAASPCRVRP